MTDRTRTDRAHDPYYDMHQKPEQARIDEPERGTHEDTVADPAGRAVPFVDGPTGASPLGSELRGDPDLDGDRGGEMGAMGGVVAGTALAGPIGGVIGGVVGATAEAAAEDDDRTRDARLETGEAGEPADPAEDDREDAVRAGDR